jgi:arylsulfatase A-like enzyme
VGNNLYCAADSGLGRGFATYRDFIFPRLTALKGASLLDRSLEVLQSAESWLETVDIDLFRAPVNTLVWLTTGNRKSAQDVNRELLEWIQNRAEPNRPFFAFANYYDAHYPYQLPGNAIHRFGAAPRESRENLLIQSWWPLDKSSVTQAELGFVVNSYDDCVAALDERLGFLFDRLSRQGVLENTWLVITADHGESFGEHPGVFCHGTSLYQTELHVPLLIIPPGGAKTPSVIDDTVSLRDLAATIVDLTGVSAAGAFPGDSLARFWKEDTPLERPAASIASSAIAEVVPNDPAIVKTREELLAPHWPLAALSERDWTYIRRDGEIDEQLFHRREDPGELRNLSTDPASQPRLEQMRGKLRELTAGPLTPDRFNR